MPIVDDCGKAHWRPCGAFDLIMSFPFFSHWENATVARTRFHSIYFFEVLFPDEIRGAFLSKQKVGIFFLWNCICTGDVWRLCFVWHMFNDIPLQWVQYTLVVGAGIRIIRRMHSLTFVGATETERHHIRTFRWHRLWCGFVDFSMWFSNVFGCCGAMSMVDARSSINLSFGVANVCWYSVLKCISKWIYIRLAELSKTLPLQTYFIFISPKFRAFRIQRTFVHAVVNFPYRSQHSNGTRQHKHLSFAWSYICNECCAGTMNITWNQNSC